MNEIIIINGRVIDPANGIDGEQTVIVRDGKIAALQKGKYKTSQKKDELVIDAKGMIVAPGFIDIHTHLREPGFEYKEDIESGSRAAAAGGYTTICCMPNTEPVNDNASVTEFILKKAEAVGLVNVIPVGAITKGLKGESLADIGDLAEAGVAAISDDGRPVMNPLVMRRAAEYAATFDLPIMDHCEDLLLRGAGVMNEGTVSTELGLAGIPAASEEVQVARDIALAKLTGAHFHITHVSTSGSIDLIRAAKKKKTNVTCDVTPHHLMLTDEKVKGYNTNTKMNPPLRTAADTKELVKALADGTIDTIATDHAPHGVIDKELGFDTASAGIVGLETALPVVMQLVHDKKLTLKRMVELFTNGLRVLRGGQVSGIKKGAVADLTIFDPNERVTIDASRFYSKGTSTPFDGAKLKGKVKFTIRGGKVIFDHEKGVSSPLGW